ncbi:putative cation-transporting ATPase 13A3 [Frankliniella fusca]|uniref:Cation-transporting ATPase n=1 Tax=Frankliniella fusca TaxID=407009 RepID=A0AAE1LDU9_9NEOP|nr:putative cation-transporting ATPase 13A3 [Frankliniella fusca]
MPPSAPDVLLDNGTKKHPDGTHGLSNHGPTVSDSFAILNPGAEDEIEVHGYTRCWLRTSLCWAFIILSLGSLRLLLHWYPHWLLAATHRRCSLARASKLLAVDRYQKHKSYFVRTVETFDLAEKSGAAAGSAGGAGQEATLSKTRVWLDDGSTREVSRVRWVSIKKLRYLWDERALRFSRLAGLDGVDAADIHGVAHAPLSAQQQATRRLLYGLNDMEIRVQGLLELLLLELLNPFYVFQIFSLAVWFSEGYYYYTIAIVIMSTFGITFSVRQTRGNQISLHSTVHSSDVVTVSRGDGEFEDVSTTDLVPGDVIVIPQHGCTLHCDAVLLNGNCIVNESMLTGESVPVTKTPLGRVAGVPYDAKEDARHTLFGGTTVIQTRFYGEQRVLAVVVRTGYLTSRGALVRSILYPPPADFRFERDSYKFIGILAGIAAAGLIYTCVAKGTRGVSAGDIAQKALDLITIVIPPALPSALSVGKLCAQSRLQKLNIFCVNSRVINVAGSLDCVCFDKTGTLTEDGLDLWGVVPAEGGVLADPIKDPRELPDTHPLLCTMAACHSLTRIDGELAGDPLDVKMFESTGWELEEPDVPDTSKFDLLVPSLVRPPSASRQAPHEDVPYEIGLVHQYQFSSTLQRMSVVTRQLGVSDLVVYCKGSPETIASLCEPETVPAGLATRLSALASQGFRVLAAGRRVVPAASLPRLLKQPRADMERELHFAGLIVMENRLKPQTHGVIRQLQDANIKVVMVTGDNVQTAVSVARECGMVSPRQRVVSVDVVPGDKDGPPKVVYSTASQPSPSFSPVGPAHLQKRQLARVESGVLEEAPYVFAVTGRSWAALRDHFPDLLPRVCVRGAVFARMSSDQKQQLVHELQDLGYYVGMCGDGANDCGALKAAHTGISLSDTESSVAAPLTAKEPHIGCVPHVIREGRAALATSSGIFKFMVAYSLTEFTSAIVLYGMDSNLTDLEFLFIDIGLVMIIAFLFSKTDSYQGPLATHAPHTSLVSLSPLLSLSLLMACNIAFQAAAYHLVSMFSWYKPFEPQDTSDYACLENFAVFCVSMFQYIGMAVAYSQGAPYRASILTNRWFSASLALMVAVCVYITLWPAAWVQSALQLVMPPFDFRELLLALAAANLAACLFFEKVVVQWLVQDKLRYCFHDVAKSRRKYLAVGRDLSDAEPCWPPLEDLRVLTGAGANGGLALVVPSMSVPPTPEDPVPVTRIATVLKAMGPEAGDPLALAAPTRAVSFDPKGGPMTAVPTVSRVVSELERTEVTKL